MSITIEYLWKDRKRHLGMPLSFTRYQLSEDRLFLSEGFLNIRDDDILLYRVRDIDTRRNLWQRLFGVGTITVLSSDKTMPTLVLKNVKNPLFVKELIHKQVEEMKQNLATYPDLDADIIARIVDVSGSNMNVEVKSMDAETGLLTFHAVSSAVIDIPGYVNKLTQTGLFSSVDYSGYQYQNGEYTLDLSCILKAIDAGGDK